MFGSYYDVAQEKLATMSFEEKIAQLLLVRYPDTSGKEIIEQYQFGGYVFLDVYKRKNLSSIKTRNMAVV